MTKTTFVFEEDSEAVIGITKGDKSVDLSPGLIILRFDAALGELTPEMSKDAGNSVIYAVQSLASWLAGTHGIALTLSEMHVVLEKANLMVQSLKKSSPPSPPSSPSTESTPNEPDSVD